MKAFYKRLIDNGEPSKVALIAVARKLVVLANTLVSEDRTWQPSAPISLTVNTDAPPLRGGGW